MEEAECIHINGCFFSERIRQKRESYLVFYSDIVEAATSYEQSIGWNYASFKEYNGVVELWMDIFLPM